MKKFLQGAMANSANSATGAIVCGRMGAGVADDRTRKSIA